MIRRCLHIFLLVVALASVRVCAKGAADPAVHGIPNFHQVNGTLYRGGEPTAQGWASLERLGVKTVIDLRRHEEHSFNAERQAVEAAGMHYVNVPMRGIVAPTDDSIFKVLALLQSSGDGPVFVHCWRGVDRTGAVIACYRIAHDGWGNQKALDEAESFGMHWFEVGLKRYVLRFSAPPQRVSAEAVPTRASESHWR